MTVSNKAAPLNTDDDASVPGSAARAQLGHELLGLVCGSLASALEDQEPELGLVMCCRTLLTAIADLGVLFVRDPSQPFEVLTDAMLDQLSDRLTVATDLKGAQRWDAVRGVAECLLNHGVLAVTKTEHSPTLALVTRLFRAPSFDAFTAVKLEMQPSRPAGTQPVTPRAGRGRTLYIARMPRRRR